MLLVLVVAPFVVAIVRALRDGWVPSGDESNIATRALDVFSQAAQTGKSPYDLIIMDVVLNEMLDGLQIFELIQRLFPTQKAIVASGHAPSERAELAVSKGLLWLAKPYSIKALTRAVERVL